MAPHLLKKGTLSVQNQFRLWMRTIPIKVMTTNRVFLEKVEEVDKLILNIMSDKNQVSISEKQNQFIKLNFKLEELQRMMTDYERRNAFYMSHFLQIKIKTTHLIQKLQPKELNARASC